MTSRDDGLDALWLEGPQAPLSPEGLARIRRSVQSRLAARKHFRHRLQFAAAALLLGALTLLAHHFARQSDSHRSDEIAEYRAGSDKPVEIEVVSPERVIDPGAELSAQEIVSSALRAESTSRAALQALLGTGNLAIDELATILNSGTRTRAAMSLLLRLDIKRADSVVIAQIRSAQGENDRRRLISIFLSSPAAGRRRCLVELMGEGTTALAMMDELGEIKSWSLRDDIDRLAIESPWPTVRARWILATSKRSKRRAARFFWASCEEYSGDASDRKSAETLVTETFRSAGDSLLRELHKHPSKWLEGEKLLLLAASHEPAAWPFIETAIHSLGIRPEVITAAGRLGDVRALPYLERWLRLADERAIAAARALGELRDPAAFEVLMSAWKGTSGVGNQLRPGLREQIAQSLVPWSAELKLRAEDHWRRGTLRPHEIEAVVAVDSTGAADLLARWLFENKRRSSAMIYRGFIELARREAALEPAMSSLIRALSRPSMRREAHKALIRITRQDLGREPSRWRDWLQTRVAKASKRASSSRSGSEVLLASTEPTVVPISGNL